MIAIKVLLTVFTGATTASGVVTSVLFMAGIWRILEKSGLKGWWALIPGARD